MLNELSMSDQNTSMLIECLKILTDNRAGQEFADPMQPYETKATALFFSLCFCLSNFLWSYLGSKGREIFRNS